MIFRIGAFLCLLALAGCGNDGGLKPVQAAFELARGTIAKRSQPPRPDIRAALTPEAVALFPGGLMLSELPERDAQGTLAPITRNGPSRTWTTIDGITVTFRNGILEATRGLGNDLMSADLGEVQRGIFGGAGRAVRVHRYLDDESFIELASFVCDYTRQSGVRGEIATGSFPATHVTEDCAGPDIRIENHYWIDGGGTIRKSVQWVGGEVGYLHSELLKEQ